MINSLLLFSAALVPGTPVEDFVQAFEQRRADAPVESPDPAIARAMEIAIRSIENSQATTSEQANQVLMPFRQALGGGQIPADYYQNISATVRTRGSERLVAIQMGAASRLALIQADGRRGNLPSEFNWIFQAEPHGYALPDNAWLIAAPLTSRDTMRMPYRLIWVRPQGETYAVTARYEGVWVRGHVRNFVQVDDGTVVANTVEPLRSFRTSPQLGAPSLQIRWRVRNGTPTERSETRGDLDLRQIDQWCQQAFSAATPTLEQARFLADVPVGETLRSVQRNQGEVVLNFGPNLRFRVANGNVSYVGRAG